MTWFLGTLTKDPQDIADTGIDWNANAFLTDRATTISTSTWSVGSGLTIVTDSETTTTTLVRISGGTLGNRYDLVNHVVLANGEEYDRTIRVEIAAK
jgi:hypothetical protein